MILKIVIILGVLVVILGYTTFNLFRKYGKLMDIVISQNKFLNKIEENITSSNNRLKKIDEKGSFESDDEIGWFFNEIKDIQNNLLQFRKS
jgi:hypothetical protein